MTIRQRFLKWAYPLFMKVGNRARQLNSPGLVVPPVPFHSLFAQLNDGRKFSFEGLKGKKVLLVNVASDCGYTPQYADLQKLYNQFEGHLEILAFPSNDFKEQETKTDSEIAQFCSVNYGIRFPVVKKTMVKKSEGQHPVYQWLTRPEKNGWNPKSPSWNFSKYLVDEEGHLLHYYDPGISPLSQPILNAIRQ